MSDGGEVADDRTERGRAERALSAHAAFEREGDGGAGAGGEAASESEAFEASTTAADARVRVEDVGSGVRYRVTVRVPTIDAVVAGETVAPVVREGWFETFERRLEDVGGATRADPEPPTAELDEAAGEVVVRTAVDADRPAGAAEDVEAVVDYVEGTFVEGLIPGYAYREPASSLLERARSSGQGSTEP